MSEEHRHVCFVCEKDCGRFNSLDGAVYFRTHGNYGSTVFDPIDGTQIEIAICDDCLRARCARVYSIYVVQAKPEEIVARWNPDDDG